MQSPRKLLDQAIDLLESGEDTTGICTECGEEREGTEPDATFYPCESCGKDTVFGAQELVICNGDISIYKKISENENEPKPETN